MNRLLLLLLAFVFTSPALAEDYVEWVGANSGVNWTAAQARAEGAGIGPEGRPPAVAALMACRAAVVDAQRNLLESMQGVRVQGTTLVKNMMIESDVIKSTVDGVLRGAQIVERTPRDDGTCRVTISAPLSGQLAAKVYDEVLVDGTAPDGTALDGAALDGAALDGAALSEALNPASWIAFALELLVPAANAAEPETWQDAFRSLSSRMTSVESLLAAQPALAVADSNPTGLVLDARGSNFIPSMSPRIRELRAGIIYPSAEHAISRRDRGQLVSLFTRDLETARNHPIVGERPIVLKGLRTFGETRTEIVLGDESSARLSELVDGGFLNDAGVVIVL